MTDLSTVYKYKTHTNKWEINNLLTFNWNNKVHSITALVGQTAEGYKYSFQESTKKVLPRMIRHSGSCRAVSQATKPMDSTASGLQSA